MRVAPVSENQFFFSSASGGILEGPIDPARADVDEAALRERCRMGDVSAFEQLYRTHGPRMKSLAANLLGNRSEAEDAVQEAFLKIYRGAASFRGAARLSTWSYRILVNTCYDFRRRFRRAEQGGGREQSPEVADVAAPASDHPLRLDLEASLATLTEKARAAFLLFEVEGFSHREIGDILGVSEGTSRSLLFEAKRALQRLLRRRAVADEART